MDAARILAVDIGTSSTKGLLVDAGGAILGEHAVGYPLITDLPGQAEQDPAAILGAVRAVLDRLGGEDVPLVFSSAMHGVIALDGGGRPLTGLWTWADQRAAAVATELRTGVEARGLHERTGTPLHAMSPLCKLRHMRQSMPDMFGAARRFVAAKEYVLEQLTGACCVDHSVASATGLFDVRELAWDPTALKLAGVDPERLPRPVPTTEVLSAGGRDIVVGATDGVLANLGVGAVAGGDPCLTLGTSGAARLTVDTPRTDPRGRLFCYVLDAGRWVTGGAINNGGLVLRWVRDALCGGEVDDAGLIELAAAAPRGARGLLFLPRLSGERYPSYRADVDGRLLGLTLSHGRAELVRAAVEGVMLSLAPLIEDLAGESSFAQVRIGGGMFEWPLCRQMLADVLGCRVSMPESRESSAMGAARLGFEALGVDVDWPVELTVVHDPEPEAVGFYREHGARWRSALEEADR